MNEFFVRRIGKSLPFGERVNEEIPVISLGDILDQVRFRYESLDANIRTLSGIIDDIGIDFFFYVIFRDGNFGLEEEKSNKVYSFDRQCISEFRREEDFRFGYFLKIHPLRAFFIGIYSSDTGFGKEFYEIFLYFLYPESHTIQAISMTLGTADRHFGLGTAVMTEESH